MMKDIEQLATQFRKAIDAALEAGEFDNDSIYRRFPRACCGDTSDLLAREFDTLKSKKVPQSLEIGLFFCQIFIFII